MPETDNQEVSPQEMSKIRMLDDFDLTMLISEIHDHGWPVARNTLKLMPPVDEAYRDGLSQH